jgi:hypothetical protein
MMCPNMGTPRSIYRNFNGQNDDNLEESGHHPHERISMVLSVGDMSHNMGISGPQNR